VNTRDPNLLKLASPLGEENDLVVERLARAGLVAELDDVDDGLPRAGDIAGQPHLLLDVQERLYRRIEVGVPYLRCHSVGGRRLLRAGLHQRRPASG